VPMPRSFSILCLFIIICASRALYKNNKR
jgi:hypothetical protein